MYFVSEPNRSARSSSSSSIATRQCALRRGSQTDNSKQIVLTYIAVCHIMVSRLLIDWEIVEVIGPDCELGGFM